MKNYIAKITSPHMLLIANTKTSKQATDIFLANVFKNLIIIIVLIVAIGFNRNKTTTEKGQ